MTERRPCWLAGEEIETGAWMGVANKATGAQACEVARAEAEHIDQAIASAFGARAACTALPAATRGRVCRELARGVEFLFDDFVRALVVEVGKTVRDARVEVERAIETLGLGAEEATRIRGEHLPLDTMDSLAGTQGIVKRVPVGACSLITPFNFPLLLAAHKIAPAIAAGAPWVLKPSEKTPLTSVLLGELIRETDWPAEAWSILPCDVGDADPLVVDDRFRLLSFTGSVEVGWTLKSRCGRKKIVLELGGDAACLVDEGADLERVVERVMVGGFAVNGQSCISVQRLMVHATHHAEVRERLIERVDAMVLGDPADEATDVGPVIDEASAQRIERWLAEAVEEGAEILIGGDRDGAYVSPTVIEGVPPDVALGCGEVFGPVVCLERFEAFDEALARVNASRFGLQTGVFTPRLDHTLRAFDELEVGAVVVNDVPSFRVDAAPYGGVKDSGLGREGVRSAIMDMTEERMLVIRR